MPECPACFSEMDYDAMMRHDAQLCRYIVRRLVSAAKSLDALIESGEYPPDSDEARDQWRHLRRAVSDLTQRNPDAAR